MSGGWCPVCVPPSWLANIGLAFSLPGGCWRIRDSSVGYTPPDYTKKNVLVLGHTREIVKQTSRKLRKTGVDHGIMMGTDTVRPYEDVQVASVQTYWSQVVRSKRIEPPAADLVIVDECHHIRAWTWQKIVESYPDAILIGLTATPCRSDGRGLGVTFDVLVECPQVPELIKHGFLVPTKTYAPAESALDLRGIHTQSGDYVVSELAERVNTDPLVGDIITHWYKHAADADIRAHDHVFQNGHARKRTHDLKRTARWAAGVNATAGSCTIPIIS
jgi:superfamily II DNA or RNA helicase